MVQNPMHTPFHSLHADPRPGPHLVSETLNQWMQHGVEPEPGPQPTAAGGVDGLPSPSLTKGGHQVVLSALCTDLLPVFAQVRSGTVILNW